MMINHHRSNAEYMTDLYAKQLNLNAEQKQQTYITILEREKTLDSIG